MYLPKFSTRFFNKIWDPSRIKIRIWCTRRICVRFSSNQKNGFFCKAGLQVNISEVCLERESSLAIEHTKLLLFLEIIAPSEQEFTPFSANVTKSLSSQLFRFTQRHNDICCKSSDKSFKIGNCKRQEQVLTFFRLLQLRVADFRPTTCADHSNYLSKTLKILTTHTVN